jgi:hypothetical protein
MKPFCESKKPICTCGCSRASECLRVGGWSENDKKTARAMIINDDAGLRRCDKGSRRAEVPNRAPAFFSNVRQALHGLAGQLRDATLGDLRGFAVHGACNFGLLHFLGRVEVSSLIIRIAGNMRAWLRAVTDRNTTLCCRCTAPTISPTCHEIGNPARGFPRPCRHHSQSHHEQSRHRSASQ